MGEVKMKRKDIEYNPPMSLELLPKMDKIEIDLNQYRRESRKEAIDEVLKRIAPIKLFNAKGELVTHKVLFEVEKLFNELWAKDIFDVDRFRKEVEKLKDNLLEKD